MTITVVFILIWSRVVVLIGLKTVYGTVKLWQITLVTHILWLCTTIRVDFAVINLEIQASIKAQS